MKTFAERCREECARDVLFLFQLRTITWTDTPEGYEWDSDVMRKLPDNDNEDDPEEMDDEEMLNRGSAVESWRTEGVYLSREEGESFGESKSYKYGEKNKNWRVYCVPANGKLTDLIRSG